MAQRDITVLKDVALITCVVQRGSADPIISAAREAGAQGATVNYGTKTNYGLCIPYMHVFTAFDST